MNEVAIITPKVELWASRISEEWNKSREGFFGAGQHLIDAKLDCSHGEWMQLVEHGIPFGISTADKLMAIARSPRLIDSDNYPNLPNSWNACYDLDRLSDDQFDIAKAAGIVRPDASFSEIRAHIAKHRRQQKHRDIQAATAVNPNIEGLYPLIYADPPWTFDTYSEKGKEISPEKHYPTLTYEEIKSFMVGDRWIGDVTHKDAALFLWCTSSNLESALGVLNAWGFTYKTNAVWDKERTGTGYLFLNQHEHILMGTRGSMPAPVKIFPSVFRSPRGKHSVKPTAVREAIEQMYPHFDKTTRLELFCRSPADGWTATGYEAHHKDAA